MKKLTVLLSLFIFNNFILNNAFSQINDCEDFTGVWQATESCRRTHGEKYDEDHDKEYYNFSNSVIGIYQQSCQEINFVMMSGASQNIRPKGLHFYKRFLSKPSPFDFTYKDDLLIFPTYPTYVQRAELPKYSLHKPRYNVETYISSTWSRINDDSPLVLSVNLESKKFRNKATFPRISFTINRDPLSESNGIEVRYRNPRRRTACQYERVD